VMWDDTGKKSESMPTADAVLEGAASWTLSAQHAQLLAESSSDAAGVAKHLTSGPTVALVLERHGAVDKWRLLCGPEDPEGAKISAPTTLRARLGTSVVKNAVHAPMAAAEADAQINAMFPMPDLRLPRTLVVIQPPLVKAGGVAEVVLDLMNQGFAVVKSKELTVSEVRAEGFYASHRGKPLFRKFVKQLTSGPCVLLVLCRREAVTTCAAVLRRRMTKMGVKADVPPIHSSVSDSAAEFEVGYFFPDLPSDPLPSPDQIADFVMRRGTTASTGNLNPPETRAGLTMDGTMQQFLSQGLVALCQEQLAGLDAVKALSGWMLKNNPNQPEVEEPMEIEATGTLTGVEKTEEYAPAGKAVSGEVYLVEEPPLPGAIAVSSTPVVVEVDTDEIAVTVAPMFSSPPVVILVIGSPGTGKTTLCARLAKSLGYCHLPVEDLIAAEVEAATPMGLDIAVAQDKKVPIPFKPLKAVLAAAMQASPAGTRFLLDGFAGSDQDVLKFEQEVAEISCVLYLSAPPEQAKERLMKRAQEMRTGETEAAVAALVDADNHFSAIFDYYVGIGRGRLVNAAGSADDSFAIAATCLKPHIVSLLAGPGGSSLRICEALEVNGFSCVNPEALVAEFAQQASAQARATKQLLDAGQDPEPAVVLPLVLTALRAAVARSQNRIVLMNYPLTAEDNESLESRFPCDHQFVWLQATRAEAMDLDSVVERETGIGSLLESERNAARHFGPAVQGLIKAMEVKKCLSKVPCSLAVAKPGPGTALERVKAAVLAEVRRAVLPSSILVVGAPASGRTTFANKWSERSADTMHLDVLELLDKELERKTRRGQQMAAMLAEGKSIPASFIVSLVTELLSAVGVRSAIFEGFPRRVEDIPALEGGFSIERVFSLDASGDSLAKCKQRYTEAGGKEDVFDALAKGMGLITAHFAMTGRLTPVPLSSETTAEDVYNAAVQATRPGFFAIIGAPCSGKSAQCAELSKALGFEVVTKAMVVEEALQAGGATAAAIQSSPNKQSPHAKVLCDALAAYTTSRIASAYILDDFIEDQEGLQVLAQRFGFPKLLVRLEVPEEQLNARAEARATAAEADFDADAAGAKITERNDKLNAITSNKCLKVTALGGPVDNDQEEAQLPARVQTVHKEIAQMLKPRVHVLVTAVTDPDLCRRIGAQMCNAGRTRGMAMVDGQKSLDAFKTTKSIELHRAGDDSFTPLPLWEAALKDAFKSNPLGEYVLVNFLSDRITSYPTVQDQIDLLQDLALVESFVVVEVEKPAVAKLSRISDEAAEAAMLVKDAIREHVRIEFQATETRPKSPVVILPPSEGAPEEYNGSTAATAKSLCFAVAGHFVAAIRKG